MSLLCNGLEGMYIVRSYSYVIVVTNTAAMKTSKAYSMRGKVLPLLNGPTSDKKMTHHEETIEV